MVFSLRTGGLSKSGILEPDWLLGCLRKCYDGKGSVVLDFDNSKAFIHSLPSFGVVRSSNFGAPDFGVQISELQMSEFHVSEFLVSEFLRSGASTSQLTSFIVQEAVELKNTTKTVVSEFS